MEMGEVVVMAVDGRREKEVVAVDKKKKRGWQKAGRIWAAYGLQRYFQVDDVCVRARKVNK